jgi:hypothetical protein
MTAQANASIDTMAGYRFGKARGLVSEAELVAQIKDHPAQGRRMGVGTRFAEGYFKAMVEAGVWTPNTGTPAPWAEWKLPVH